MQRYYFHVHDGGGTLLDPEGTNLQDDDAALRTAIGFVRSLLCEDLTSGLLDLRGRIEVVRSSGELLRVLPFADCICVLSGRA
ncbi:hypothetical protein [uncultured Sphingomonas sp.]|uniref:DUF6894 family protein n=1 Tax=uncultured Sphingomonas sp. TaxID=158754 RepID=UPI0025F51BAD|nr:hypothetical protein [uncultured Sphingomonas sp.]